jgi:hypothetical protein
MAKAKTRTVRIEKIHDADIIDAQEVKEEDILLDDEPVSSSSGKSTQPSLDESPLLNSGRIELAHATNEAPDPELKPDNNPPVDPASNQNPLPEEEPGYSYDDAPAPDQVFELDDQASAPNQPPAGPSSSSDTLNLPDDAAKEGSTHLANFIMDAYERFIPEVSHYYSSVNEKQIKKLEESGDLLEGALQTVKSYNKENKILLEERAKADVKYLKKHLTKVFQVRQISASPEVLLVCAMLIVVLGQFILFFKIKKESNDMMDALMAKINMNRNGGNVKKDEILTPTVEVV